MRHAFGPSCTEFVYPECWHFDNDASSKINDVLTEHGGLLHVLPLAVLLRFFFAGQVGGTILNLSYSLTFIVGPLLTDLVYNSLTLHFKVEINWKRDIL